MPTLATALLPDPLIRPLNVRFLGQPRLPTRPWPPPLSSRQPLKAQPRVILRDSGMLMLASCQIRPPVRVKIRTIVSPFPRCCLFSTRLYNDRNHHTIMPGASLKVGIVGAGVAGLSAAIALRRVGHDVEVRTPKRSRFAAN